MVTPVDPSAMRFADGSTGVAMHNRYPVLQAQVTRRAVDAWERRHRGKQVYFFQRAGYSGRPGSPGFESAQFPGDETVDWQRGTGLPSVAPDMLNRACLLYTSDAADEEDSVDLGGRRII